MARIIWDKIGKRFYESGLDKGVLYLPDGSAVPWNGLTSVIESFDNETSPVYYDGMKINDLVTLGDFSATMKAITYPDEFNELEGLGSLRRGVFLGDQPPKTFGLCYRTQIGNDVSGDAEGYKIHLIYNLLAIPHEKTHVSVSDQPSLEEFEWGLTAIPEQVPGLRPSAHFILNTKDLDPWLLEDIEAVLYGDDSQLATLIPMSDLVVLLRDWYRIKIIDNGNGTWTARTQREGFIEYLDDEEDWFEIHKANARYLDTDTFVISDTLDIADVPAIKIIDNGDGTWTAVSDEEGLISVTGSGIFTIFNATISYIGTDYYQISDTI